MNNNELEKLKSQLSNQVKHQTRWVRRVPLLLGLLGGMVTLTGYWRSAGSLIALGLCIGFVGFGAYAVLWHGLHDEEKL
jgi:hypothetical protein